MERPVGTCLNVTVYPELHLLPKITEKFIVDKPFRAKKAEPTKLAPTAKSIEITKSAETVVLAASYVFSADLLADMSNILSNVGSDKGISRHSIQSFLKSYCHQHKCVCESFLMGTIGEYIRFLKRTAEDFFVKEIFIAGKEEYTSRVLMSDENKLAEILQNYAEAKNRCTGIVNENPSHIFALIRKALELVSSIPLIRTETNTADMKVPDIITEDDDRVAGVLIVGGGMRQFLPTKKMKLVRDVRRSVVEFTPQDYQSAMETKWIISDTDEYSQRQKRAAESCKDTLTGDHPRFLIKTVVKAKESAYTADIIPTTHKTENTSTIVTDVDYLDVDGKYVIVDCLDDVFTKTDDTTPMRDKLTLVQSTVLGSTGAMRIEDPKRNRLPSSICLHDGRKVTCVSYQDTMGMLTNSKFFDNRSLSQKLNKCLLEGKLKVDALKRIHYSPADTFCYQEMACSEPPHTRVPGMGKLPYQGNRCSYLGSLSYDASCSPTYSDYTMLEVSPVFDFFLTKRKSGGDDQVPNWKEKFDLLKDEKDTTHDDIKTFQIRGFPRRLQGNMPICYTGESLWFGQAHQLLTLFGEAEKNESVTLWKNSLQCSVYWFELYAVQFILCGLYKNQGEMVNASKKKTDKYSFSVERYYFAIADSYFDETGLLAFPQNLACLQAWATVSQYQTVKRNVSEIVRFVSKIADGLMSCFTRSNSLGNTIDVLTHLSPITDANVPTPVNIRGAETNMCFSSSVSTSRTCERLMSENNDGSSVYTWKTKEFPNKSENFRDSVIDKVFLSCLCSMTELHAGYLNQSEMRQSYDKREFFLIKNDKLLHLSEDTADLKKEREARYKMVCDHVLESLKGVEEKSSIYRVNSTCPDSMHNENVLSSSYTCLTNGILFLPATIKNQWGHINDCSSLVNFVYLEPRIASPRVPFIICSGIDNSETGFVGLGGNENAVYEHPDCRFYTSTQHDYQPASLLTQQAISLAFLTNSPVLAIYSSIVTQLRLDPVAFAAYADKINPPFSFVVLRTSTYVTEHAYYVAKKGSNVFTAPENQVKAVPDNNCMNVQVHKRMAFIDNSPGSAAVCLPNVFVRGRLTSDDCFVRDYNKMPCHQTSRHYIDEREIFSKLKRLSCIRTAGCLPQKSVGCPSYTILDILPCPCPIDPFKFEAPVCPLGRNLAYAFVNHEKQDSLRAFFDHSIPDCNGLSTFNPWGSHEVCLGRLYYADNLAPSVTHEGFFPFYQSISSDNNRVDLSKFVAELKSKCKTQSSPYFTSDKKKCQTPSTLFLLSYPQHSYTEGAKEAAERHELTNYLIRDFHSPLAGVELPKYRGSSCVSYLAD